LAPRQNSRLFVGLMSGTSMDGADAVLAECRPGPYRPRLLSLRHLPYPPALREALSAVQGTAAATIDEAMAVSAALGDWYGRGVLELLGEAGVRPAAIRAIGCHGQTVRHKPDAQPPWTLQLGDLARVAVTTGIATIGDFRAADIAAGGQGAPLAPLFHPVLFGTEGPVAVANLGGIANLTIAGERGKPAQGFDTGPGNALLDAWIERNHAVAFDDDGALARRGSVRRGLLARLLGHPYFARPPPKSTGRDEFHLGWLELTLQGLEPLPVADIQATLAELTATTLAAGVRAHAAAAKRLVLCGGGVRNSDLVARIARALPSMEVVICEDLGIPANGVEPLMMAWLAAQRAAGRALDTRAVTGASKRVTLGCVYRP
jgi:anhydro-N-acetylmuramic acid kinase